MADLDLIPLHVVPAIEIPLLRVHVRQLGTAYSIVVVVTYIAYASSSPQRAIQTALTDTRDTPT
jgi:hypothetical protein